MNASIYCAILKEKSGAPKEKIKGVSKTAGGSVATTGHVLAVHHACKRDCLLMARLVAGDSTIGNTKPPTWQTETSVKFNLPRQEPNTFLATLSKETAQ